MRASARILPLLAALAISTMACSGNGGHDDDEDFDPGMFEQSGEGGPPFNTLVLADRGVLTTYRKIHLYDSFGYRESDTVGAGAIEPVVVDVRGVPVGLMTCYDLRFPELGRALVDAGAQVFAVPAAWVAGERKAMSRIRALPSAGSGSTRGRVKPTTAPAVSCRTRTETTRSALPVRTTPTSRLPSRETISSVRRRPVNPGTATSAAAPSTTSKTRARPLLRSSAQMRSR